MRQGKILLSCRPHVFVRLCIHREGFEETMDHQNNCTGWYRIPKHPNNIKPLLNININATPFYFQQVLNIDSINNETKCNDRKAHLFWEIPVIDAKINDLMNPLSHSGKAAARLVRTGDSKDSRGFFLIKKKGQEKGTKQ